MTPTDKLLALAECAGGNEGAVIRELVERGSALATWIYSANPEIENGEMPDCPRELVKEWEKTLQKAAAMTGDD